MFEYLLILTLFALPVEPPSCNLNILVRDSQGPLPGAIVLLFHNYDEPSAYVSSSDGRVTITNLPGSPDYFVGASFPGYQIITEATACPRPMDDPLVLTFRVNDFWWEVTPDPPKVHGQETNLVVGDTFGDVSRSGMSVT